MRCFTVIPAILVALALVGPVTTKEYTCSSRKPCTLHDVNLVSEREVSEVRFPHVTDPLVIASGKIPAFTRELAEKLMHIVDLTMNNLELATVFVRPEMTHLEATNNRIETLLVEDGKVRSYDLISLNLTSNHLSDVAVLARFTKLRVLTLDRNKLNRLTMDTFTGMTELRTLSVAQNQLFSVETDKSFQLIKLRSLSLGGNQLLELDLSNWELESLKELDLTNNTLYLLNGGLEQFKVLQQARIAGNYWKCESLIAMGRLQDVQFDADLGDRCTEKGMAEVRRICCTLDATQILSGTGDRDHGLFSEKWEQLQKLHEAVQYLNESVVQNTEQLAETAKTREEALEERIQQLEEQHKALLEKFEDKEESVALNETNELKEVVADHKTTIDKLEEKQTELSGELEGFVERLNSMRDTLDEKEETITAVTEKVEALESQVKGADAFESFNSSVTRLEGSLRFLEGQQLKYHLSSVDLKSQISKERSRIDEVQHLYGKLAKECESIREQMHQVEESIGLVLGMMNEISISDE